MRPGSFTYAGNKASLAMGAAGAVCMQEFAQYDDFRIQRSMDHVADHLAEELNKRGRGTLPVDAYAMTYLCQALYQTGGERWRTQYPLIRDAIVANQNAQAGEDNYGSWGAGGHVGGKQGELYGTAIGVFALSIPNRYLPILQEGEQ